jgi:uncharacterized Zn finger protein
MAAINLLQLKRLATNRSFARGEAYFKEGRVHSLATYEGASTAIVSGQDDYCVTLRSTDREMDYSCDCPIGLEGEFCKHLVAVGLASLDPDPESKGKPGRKRKRAVREDDLRAYLKRQDKDTLIAMLAREAEENRNLRDRLLKPRAPIPQASILPRIVVPSRTRHGPTGSSTTIPRTTIPGAFIR